MPAQKTAAAAGAAAAGIFATVVMIPAVILGGGGGGSTAAAASVSQNAANTGGQCTYTPKKSGGATAAGITLSASQLQIAGTGVGVAKQRKLPAQASIDVLTAGMQESTLTNLDHGDRDSVGWLQQRPSQGWRTVAQIMDPAYAAGMFFDHLVKIANWQKLLPGVAIQKVQISGTPAAYTKWVPMATALAASLLGDPSVALTCAPGGAGAPPGQAPNAKVGAVLARARAQLGLPYCFDGGTPTGPSHGVGGAGCEGQAVGFDCSGLTLYGYAGVGLTLQHSAANQYTDPAGHQVPITQVQPGDLVFLSSDGSQAGIHHVAMIWSTTGKPDGSGQIIEAQDFNVPVHIRSWRGTGEGEVMPYAWRSPPERVPGGRAGNPVPAAVTFPSSTRTSPSESTPYLRRSIVMIETIATAAAAATVRGTGLVQYATSVPARALDLVRQANSVILAGPVPKVAPTEPPGGAKVMQVVGWVGWGVFAASIAGVLLICIKMATNSHRNRSGDGGGEEAGKLFWPLLACIVGSSAGSILGVVA